MQKIAHGFSLIEMSIALVLFAVVGAALLQVQVRQGKRDSARAQADQLILIRDALQTYVEVHRSSILANTSIPYTVGAGGQVNNTQTQLPSLNGLIGLGLLPVGFKTTSSLNSGGYSLSAVTYQPVGCLLTDPKSCRIGGYVRLTNPLLERGTLTEVSNGYFDGDLAFDALDVLGANGFVSIRRGGAYTSSNGSFTLPNDASFLGVAQPAGILGIQFAGASRAGTPVAYSDFCPGDTITIGNSKVGNASPYTYNGNVSFNATSYTASTTGINIAGSANSAGKTCSGNTAYQYPDTPVNQSGVAAGYSTTGANNTGVLRISCTINALGTAVPRFTIYSC